MKLLRDTQDTLHRRKQARIKSTKSHYKEKERYRKKEQRSFINKVGDFFSGVWNFFGFGTGPLILSKLPPKYGKSYKANKKKKHKRKITQLARRINRKGA